MTRSAGGGAITEICNVSECIAKAPPDWESRWDFNDACCYNSESEALATVPASDDGKYELFAYRMFPFEFVKVRRRTLDLPDAFDLDMCPVVPELDLSGFRVIGYDVAGAPIGHLGFNCSPLSCNGMCGQFPVNRFCLIEDLETAFSVADEFGRIEPEPGPFYLYQVLRKRSDRWHHT